MLLELNQEKSVNKWLTVLLKVFKAVQQEQLVRQEVLLIKLMQK